MDRNTIIAFLLIGAILVTWLFINTPDETKQPQNDKDTMLVNNKTSKDSLEKIKTQENNQVRSKEKSTFENLTATSKDSGRIITIETDLAIYELSTQGGNFHKVYLKKFNNWYSADKNNHEDYYNTSVQLINYSIGNAYDISFISEDGKAINTQDLEFITTAPSKLRLAGRDSIEVIFKLLIDTDKTIVKKYLFHAGKYLISSNIELIGLNGAIADNTYHVVWKTGIRLVEKNTVSEASTSSSDIYYGDEKVVVDAPEDGEKISQDFNGNVDWVDVRNKYFAAIIIPENPDDVEGAFVEGQTFPTNNYGRK